MRNEVFILIILWIIAIGFVFIIPKNKWRLAVVAFLFKQAITWVTGLIVIEFGLISYPVRFFPEVNRSSFSYEYFFYPIICSIFNVFYPNDHNKIIKFLYYCSFCTVLTVSEVIFEKYTKLITYVHWTWYFTWMSLFLTFMATRWFCIWFFKGISQEFD
ncbi:hypothetical protein PU629_09295 [Pullulanibacillus sp. KACC 23026]|uniref:CBO0543 family protein n=1 Tax=Pullulanibacillus sp. KACC 23026 TaxID=3028315 RepID=UPI0023AE8F46|nr:CBO0543 family protein [Pullulanibacillus sp. KACC 23026]WEG14531.1 hypothetical protein PU629_09295 [Pullulanibacillus sp. KACC 23026]